MMKNRIGHLALAASLAVALAAPAFAQPHGGGHGGHGAAPKDMKGMLHGNDAAMAGVRSTGDVDVDFALMMRIHHLGTVEMSEELLRKGRDARMKQMATEIIAAQRKEIAVFDRFLAARGYAPDGSRVRPAPAR